MSKISLIIPCYNEEGSLVPFMQEINGVAAALVPDSVELIFVDDGSRDGTLPILRQLSEENEQIHYLSFSRNFGKESAILAGLKAARGEYVAVMDADLQDPPALLPEMLRAVREEGYDCAGTRRVTRRGEPVIRSLFARMFYRLVNMVSDTHLVDGARDYKLMSRPVVDALLSMPEYNRFSKGLYEWVGFKTKWLEFENVERVAGETKWSFWKLFKYSIDGIVGFTTMPLSIASMLGILFMFLSFGGVVFLCVRQLLWHQSVSGWTSLACIIIFFCGVQLLSLGIIGQYLAKTYMEVKRRPIFIVKERDNKRTTTRPCFPVS